MHKLIFVRSGHLDIEGGFGGSIVFPGHMIVIPAERQVNISARHGVEMDVVHLDPNATNWQHPGCWVAPAKPLAHEMIAQAVALCHQNKTKIDDQKFNIFVAALSTLCPDWFTNPRIMFLQTAQSKITARPIDYIRNNLATAQVKAAALHVGIAQRRLHRYRISEFGLNLRALIREVRIIYAIELLVKDDFSIGSISHKVGYASISAFITAFKFRTQVTPSEFLNAMQVAHVDDLDIGLTPTLD